MPNSPRALVIRTAGTNCDGEMIRAFQLAGARAELVHVDRLAAEPARIDEYDLIGFPGG
ncbi:MAG: phosphoribosylformylglycinamidine synthase subunit PurQ, partial [Phycisphaerales bacterium]